MVFLICFIYFASYSPADAKTALEVSATYTDETRQVSGTLVHSDVTKAGTFDIDSKLAKTRGKASAWHVSLEHLYAKGFLVVDDGVRYDNDRVYSKVGVGFGWWDVNATVGAQIETYDGGKDKFFRASVRSRKDKGIFETFGSVEYLRRKEESRVDYRSYCRAFFGSLFFAARVERVGGVKYSGLSIGAVLF
jgi:hypothetical protein|tara:strand:+ start:2522 stop:3097 length:576 start_codon:yes stop_codon:yes gene_type:complete